MIYILKGTLQLLSPIMPFITSEIWEILHKDDKKAKIISETIFENIDKKNEGHTAIEQMKVLQDIIVKIRTLRSEMNISPAVLIDAMFNVLDDDKGSVVKDNEGYIKSLAKLNKIEFGRQIKRPKNSALALAGGFEIFLPLEGLIDIEKEKARLKKEIDLAQKEVERTNEKMKNENFISHAPASEIEKIKARLKEANQKIEKINENLKFLQ